MNIEYFLNLSELYYLCLDCAKHYKDYLLNKPPILISKDSLFKWTVDIHYSVNQRLNKETITYQQAYDIWLNKPVEKKDNV